MYFSPFSPAKASASQAETGGWLAVTTLILDRFRYCKRFALARAGSDPKANL